MGYTLKIGEATIEPDPEIFYIRTGVRGEEHENAPAFGEPTDRSNSRWPSYNNWYEFERVFNLEDVFRDEKKGLITGRPNVALITKWHKERIDQEYENFMKKYPDSKPCYNTESDKDKYLVRMVWLKYWVDWALENCNVPAFYCS